MTKQYAKKMHKKMWLIISEMNPKNIDFAKGEALAKMKVKKIPSLGCYMCEIYTSCGEDCPFKKDKKKGCTDNKSPYAKLCKGVKSKKLWKRWCLEIANMWE